MPYRGNLRLASNFLDQGSLLTLCWSKGDSNSQSQPHTVRSKAPAPSVVRLKRRPFDPGPEVRIHLPPAVSRLRTRLRCFSRDRSTNRNRRRTAEMTELRKIDVAAGKDTAGPA